MTTTTTTPDPVATAAAGIKSRSAMVRYVLGVAADHLALTDAAHLVDAVRSIADEFEYLDLYAENIEHAVTCISTDAADAAGRWSQAQAAADGLTSERCHGEHDASKRAAERIESAADLTTEQTAARRARRG